MAHIIAFPVPAPVSADADPPTLVTAEAAEQQLLLAAMRAHPSNFRRPALRLVPDTAP
jgi:hypothetical protein